LRKFINKEFLGFFFVGIANTLFTYMLYALFIGFFTYGFAYTVAYVVGVFLSLYLNTVFVFRNTFSFKKVLQYPFVYVIQYVIGILLIYIFIGIMGINEYIAPIFAISLTMPITFLLARYIIRG